MSSNPIQLMVGLANPGERYAATRHNAGAWFIEQLNSGQQLPLAQKLQAVITKTTELSGNNHPVWLAIPTTFMNHSGRAVRAISQYYKLAPETILVAHDDLDLPAGSIKLKFNGGHGGHNGLRDIFSQLGSQAFWRLRIGIGRPTHSSAVQNFVLNAPSKTEQTLIDDALQRANHIVPQLLSGEFEAAMQLLHTIK